MATIRKATTHDFERVFPLIQQFNNPLLNREDWQKLFLPRWGCEEDYLGFLIEEEEQVVGFLGTIFSRRIIDGQEYKFCNLTTWIVQKEYRGMSLMLLFEVLKLKEYTIINLTANRVAAILRKFGFQDLASQLFVLLPLPMPASYKITTDHKNLTERLNEDSLKIHRDHADLKCSHMLVEKDGQQCYLIYDIVKRKKLPVARIHHISSREFFLQNAARFAFTACQHAGTAALMLPENLLGGQKPRFAFRITQKQAQIFRSDQLQSSQIDMLYSELQVLGLRS